MLVTKPLDLPLLGRELTAAGVPYNGLGTSGATAAAPNDQDLHTFAADGTPSELPPEAVPVVDAHVAPPLVTEFAGTTTVSAITRTTDAAVHEVFRFPCEQMRMYEATMVIRGVDAVSFASKRMVGEFMWKRTTGNAVVVGITVVSDIKDTAAAAWVPNCTPSGSDVIFTVTGAAGRTIDWMLSGPVGTYAPAGLEG